MPEDVFLVWTQANEVNQIPEHLQGREVVDVGYELLGVPILEPRLSA